MREQHLRIYAQRGTIASYVCYVYNARRGESGPRLDSEIRLYRDGKEIFRSEPRPVTPSPGKPDEIIAGGVLQLGTATPPGGYLLEIIVTDRLGRKPARATQMVDFEIVQ